MEATWMERDRGCTLAWRCLPCQFELSVVPVPDADVVLGACDDKLFTEADIHAGDLFMVERSVHILTPGRLDVCSIQGQVDFEELIVAVNVVEHILSRIHHNLRDGLFFDLDVLRLFTIT